MHSLEVQAGDDLHNALILGTTTDCSTQTCMSKCQSRVAVYVDRARTDEGRYGYRAEFTTDLMAGLGTNDVDVVVLNVAPVLFCHRVLRDGVRLLSRELRATTTRAGEALSRYFDFLPQLEKMDTARRYAAGVDSS